MIIKLLIILAFCLLFWLGCYKNTGTDEKNLLGFRSYPDEIQNMIYRNENLSKKVPAGINMLKVVISNIVVFAVIFGIIGAILKYTLGFENFMDSFIYFLIFGEALNLFDLIVIDLVWWRNTSRIRFSFIPEKEMYQNPKKHVDSFLRGIPSFALSALLAACILCILP